MPPGAAAQAPVSCSTAGKNLYVRDVMTDLYLWSAQVPNVDPTRFVSPEAYLDAVRYQLIPDLRNRPLSVVRAVRGQQPFMQKNVPKYAPPWVRTVTMWADASKREVS